MANRFPKGKGNGLRAKNDKGSDKIWGSENECTTQGLERFLREILELPEVLIKGITGNIFSRKKKSCTNQMFYYVPAKLNENRVVLGSILFSSVCMCGHTLLHCLLMFTGDFQVFSDTFVQFSSI